MADQRETTRRTLHELLTSAVGDAMVTEADVRRAGIPSRFARSVASRSAKIRTEQEAAEVADEIAETISVAMSAVQTTDPRKLAESVPRL